MSNILNKRSYICQEIVVTEEHYVRDLEVIVNVFMDPMKKKKIISEDLIMAIFGNVRVLLNINKQLLEALYVAVKHDSGCPDYANANLGAVILRFCPFFKMYSHYCKQQNKAIAIVRKMKKTSKFYHFYADCRKNPACRGMEMTSFLIMPVQRIPRYQLLLQELQKRTPPDHPDYVFIQKALEAIVGVAKECNSAMNGDRENSLRLSIQNALGSSFVLSKASRKLLEYTPCVWMQKTNVEVTAFLFSDLLILTNRFDSELNLRVFFKTELFMYNYHYNPVEGREVIAQNAFESFRLLFETEELAQNWAQMLDTQLRSLIDRSVGAKCEICFGPLRPAYCCHCMKCDRICCQNCCDHINSEDRNTASKNMFCLSCLSYNAVVLNNNTRINVLTEARNSNNSKDFLQPVFVCDMATKAKQSLIDGWEACMLNDSRVYYFNREKWLSSWCIPTNDFDSDAPYGWQKYYDKRGVPFYYNTKTKQTSEDKPLAPVERSRGCPACGYDLSASDIQLGICPGCNTNVKL